MSSHDRERYFNSERVHQIIEAITEEGPLTYKELLPKLPALTREDRVGDLVAKGRKWGVLQNLTGDGDLPEGRTQGQGGATKFVEISRQAGYVVGVNVGRTYFAIGVADPNGRLISTYGNPPSKDLKDQTRAWRKYRKGQIVVHKRLKGHDGLPLLKHTAKMTVARLEELEIPDDLVRGITLSLPVPVSTTDGKTLTSSIERTLWEIDVERQFKTALGKSRYPKLQKVIIANDADVAARGEVRYGKAWGKRDVIAIHAAFGVGAGIITDGKILRTGVGGGAGEIGHCVLPKFREEGHKYGLPPLYDKAIKCECGCPGHLEALASGDAIVKRIARAGNGTKPKPPKRLAEVLEDPEKTTDQKLERVLRVSSGKRPWKPGQAALLDAARLLGGAVHLVTHLVKPEAVYVSGRLSEAGELFLDEIKEAYGELGSLVGYAPEIDFGTKDLGTGSAAFDRRLIMVRGAAMTAVRSTKPLISLQMLKGIEAEHISPRSGQNGAQPEADMAAAAA